MSEEAKQVAAIILFCVPTIVYGGFFLLRILSGEYKELGMSPFQKSMFRAGHSHAGVLIIIALIAQLLIDNMGGGHILKQLLRWCYILSAVLIPAGFFFSAIGRHKTKPGSWIKLLYFGVAILVVNLLLSGVLLLM